MKLSKKLSKKQFFISQLLILIASLFFLAGLHYILNIQDQPAKTLFESGPVTTLPKSLRLDLDQPDQDSLTFSGSAIVSGQTAPSKEILISTDSEDLVIKSKANGSFSTVIKLNEGVNMITASVFDVDGDSRFVQRTVYYSKEKI